MPVRRPLSLILISLCTVPTLTAQTREVPAVQDAIRLDRLGDPLPKYALARIGTERFTHGARVLAAFVSPDGRSIKAIDEGRNVLVWEAATGKAMAKFSLDAKQMGFRVTLSPDGKTFAGDSNADVTDKSPLRHNSN